jgi:hypothetical protein
VSDPTPLASDALFTEVKGYIVIDKHGEPFEMRDLCTARVTADLWNKTDPDESPHRVCEVVWREVQS